MTKWSFYCIINQMLCSIYLQFWHTNVVNSKESPSGHLDWSQSNSKNWMEVTVSTSPVKGRQREVSTPALSSRVLSAQLLEKLRVNGGLLASNLRRWLEVVTRKRGRTADSCKASANGGETQGTLPAICRRQWYKPTDGWRQLGRVIQLPGWCAFDLRRKVVARRIGGAGQLRSICWWRGDSGRSPRRSQETTSHSDGWTRRLGRGIQPSWQSPASDERERSNFRQCLK